MIQKLINHWTERPSCVFAESLRIRLEVYKHRPRGSHSQAPSWFPWSQAPLGQNLGSCRGGVRWEGGELQRWSEQRCKGIFYTRFTGFKGFFFYQTLVNRTISYCNPKASCEHSLTHGKKVFWYSSWKKGNTPKDLLLLLFFSAGKTLIARVKTQSKDTVKIWK